MIVFSANTRKATATTDDAITTRSVGIPVSLVLSSEFDGLAKTLCAKNGTAAVDVVLVGDAVNAVLPPDVLLTTGQLQIGIYAADDEGNIVIPTVWALVGQVKQGAMPSGVDPLAPSPSWVAQVQNIASEAIQNSEQAIETANDAKEAAITAQDSAQASASAAAQSAADAGNSANAAAGSATDASESADAAAGSASTASTKAGEAAASATTASGAAATATTQAGNASDSAAAAAQSASEAEASTETASTKAGEASASATAAAGSAATAAQTASEAAQSATQAANSASSASTSATAAGMAQTGAETAQTAAETAAQSVSASAAQIQQNANDITDLKSAVDEVEKSLETDYAKVDGYYDEMAVGSAEQLISTVLTEDQVPYNFRISGGSADIGNRETDMVVGGTVAWNQLIKRRTTDYSEKGVTLTVNNHALIINGEATSQIQLLTNVTSIPAKQGHAYMLIGCPSGGAETTYRLWTISSTAFPAGARLQDMGRGKILKAQADETVSVYINVYPAAGVLTNLVFNPLLFDLTQMFGPTIADYIYALETANAGAGVAFFRKLFPNDYYEYNAGELMSVKTSAHEMVGFNQWDEKWLAGHINSSGEQVSDGTYRLISKNFIPVIPNLQYCFTLTSMTDCGITIYGYDENEEFIGVVYDGSAYSNTRLFTPGDGVHYIKFQMYATYGQTASLTYNNDICLNLSWSGYRNGEYEPYEKHSYALDDSLELRGIPKLSADNELYYDGDTYESDGTVTRRYGIVDLGTLNWLYFADGAFMYAVLSGVKNDTNQVLCALYPYADTLTFGIRIVGNILRIYGTGYTDATSFKAAMSGVMLVYELATPTTETAEPYTNPQIVNDFGTEEYVDYAYEQGLRDVKIPVGHVTEYQANLRDKLQHLPDLADSDGNYLIQQTGNQMVLVRFRIPQAPTTDGTYTLKATVSGGTPTYVWVDDSATTEEANA